jgi:hypothetical protein
MKKPKMPDLALGSFEAAAVLGVHWTTPGRMVEKGILTARTLKSPVTSDPERSFVVYSLSECDADFAEYEEKLRSRGGKSDRRPRGFVDHRTPALKRLSAEPSQITFGDAISTGEAAEILGVHWTFPSRMVAQGKLIGRVLHNGRNSRSRCWIFSRASVEANAAATARLQASGRKKGRARTPA